MTILNRLSLLALALAVGACATAPPAAETPAARAEATPQVAAPPLAVDAPAGAPAAAEAAAADTASASLDAPLPVDPAVREGRLDNGLTYVVRANYRPEDRAEVWLVVNAGSVVEDEDQQGLAHFVEHMAFNGTRNFAEQELVEYLESIGMRFGPDLNAYTSFDETVYMLRVPTDEPEILHRALQILEDWAHGIAFSGEEIDKERGVVVEEWRLGRGAGARILDQQAPVLFRGSRYAERLTIGKKEILEGAPHEALVRFYHDWYRPDLMAVIAVGDFDPAAMEEKVRRQFASIPAPERPRKRVTFPVPGHAETLVSIATDPEATSTSVAVYTKHPVRPQGRYRDYRRSLVEALYDSMLNARLDEIAQQPDAPFLYASSASTTLVRSSEMYYQAAGVKDGEVVRGLEALLTETERVDRHGFTAGELERAKKNLLRAYEQAYQERDSTDSRSLAAEYTRHFLEGESIPGIAVELELVRRFLPTITLEEVNRLVQEWISEENRVILVSAPEKAEVELPTEGELLAVTAAAQAQEVEPYEDRVVDAPLVAEPPVPSPVVAESHIEELGVTQWTLANGVEVVLKPTDFKQDEVLISAFSPGGHSLVPDEDFTSASLATTLVGEGGLGEFSLVELQKALAGKAADASPYIGELEEGIHAAGSPEDLETLFQLIYLHITSPQVDAEAAGSLLTKLRAFVANRDARPETVFHDRVREAASQGHPRRRPLTAQRLDEVDFDRAVEIYRDRFADAGDFTFLIVGSFDPAAIRPLVETYLGGLPSTGRQESWRDVGVEPPAGVVEVEARQGREPKSLVTLLYSAPAEWSRQNLHDITSLASVLAIRLREILREDLGATYGVSVAGTISPRPRQLSRFTISFGCAPENVDELIRTVFAEIEAIRADGVEATYLERVQEAQRRQREVELKENDFWTDVLSTYYSLELDPRLILDYDALVESLSSDSIRRAARRYLLPDRYVLGVLRPEEEQAGAEGPTAD